MESLPNSFQSSASGQEFIVKKHDRVAIAQVLLSSPSFYQPAAIFIAQKILKKITKGRNLINMRLKQSMPLMRL